MARSRLVHGKIPLSIAYFPSSELAAAERGNEMHFAIFGNGVENPSGCDFAVDGHRDRRPYVSVLKQLLIDPRESLAEMPNEFADSSSGDINALKARSEFPKQSGNHDSGHLK
jgi:hypothetical protein